MKPTSTLVDRHATTLMGWLTGLLIVGFAGWGLRTPSDFSSTQQFNNVLALVEGNPVISRAGGLLMAVRFEENEVVEKGDTLLLIDPREHLSQQSHTEAAIRREKARLQALTTNVHVLTQAAQAASDQMAASKARLEQQLYIDRYQKEGAPALDSQQLALMKATLHAQASAYQVAQDQYGVAVSKLADTELEKEMVNAHLATLRTLLDQHKLDVRHTTVVAPGNGRMGRCPLAVGQRIDAGQILAYVVKQQTTEWWPAPEKRK